MTAGEGRPAGAGRQTSAPAGARNLPDPQDFLSGRSGNIVGARRRTAAAFADLVLDLRLRLEGARRQADRQASRSPRRRVLALSVYRPDSPDIAAIARELRASDRHEVSLVFGSLGGARPGLERETALTGMDGGKFRNANLLLDRAGDGADPDWTLVVDDDVVLAPRFLDRFIALCEAFELEMAQPAQTRLSHAAWPVVRRRGGTLARETRFVEIGPVTAFGRRAAGELLPFPEVDYGWGLDNHWSAVAAEHGWRIGVVDALPVRHERRPVAEDYPHGEAVAEAQRLLAGRPWTPAAEAAVTVATHRRIPRAARAGGE